MNEPIKVGITGGIGSGKSIICKILSQLEVPVYDADRSARLLMNANLPLITAIKDEFGDDSYTNGLLNRDYMARQVFGNKVKLNKLNQLVHPAVGKDFNQWVLRQTKATYIVKEAALLYESNTFKQLDKMIVVTAPKEIRIARIMRRDPFRSKDEIHAIMNKQWSDEQKLSMGGIELRNDESSALLSQVLNLHDQLSRRLI
jgi:dephospho-CoA kinase